jgi:acyl-phosphate glycerol 3-phosphate acyltransferase
MRKGGPSRGRDGKGYAAARARLRAGPAGEGRTHQEVCLISAQLVAAVLAIAAVAGSYALGSVLFGVLLGRLLGGKDLREADNPGGSGSFRQFGPAVGSLVATLDLVKGALAVGLGRGLGLDGVTLGFVAAAAVAGHNWPLWFGFRGGGGLATATGALVVLGWRELLLALAVSLAMAAVYKIPGISGRLPMAALPFGALFGLPVAVWAFCRSRNPAGTVTAVLCLVIIGVRGLQMLGEGTAKRNTA